jgi:hypothetical protein
MRDSVSESLPDASFSSSSSSVQKRFDQCVARAFLISARFGFGGSVREFCRVRGGVDLLQFADGDVGVALCGRQRGV